MERNGLNFVWSGAFLIAYCAMVELFFASQWMGFVVSAGVTFALTIILFRYVMPHDPTTLAVRHAAWMAILCLAALLAIPILSPIVGYSEEVKNLVRWLGYISYPLGTLEIVCGLAYFLACGTDRDLRLVRS